MNKNIKSIILLSGGLDSLVSLGAEIEKHNVSLALTFDYGQKSVTDEIEASRKIADYYGIKHKIIKLDWLKEITKTALVGEAQIPTGKDLANAHESMSNVWVPNRNGLFLNIAASFADADDYDYIVIGANREEGETFTDNTETFIERVNSEFEYSTVKKVKVLAPLIKFDKTEIVSFAIKNKVPLELTMSCYQGGGKHCGKCESCVRLKNALKANSAEKYLKILF